MTMNSTLNHPKQVSTTSERPLTGDTAGRVTHQSSGVKSRAATPTLHEQVLRRLQQAVQQSLQEESAIVAAIDSSYAILMKALIQLDHALDEALACTSEPIERIDGLAKAIDLMMRITRQMDRFQRLKLLLRQTKAALRKGNDDEALEAPRRNGDLIPTPPDPKSSQ